MKKRFVVRGVRNDESVNFHPTEIFRETVVAYSRADAIAVSGVEDKLSMNDRITVDQLEG